MTSVTKGSFGPNGLPAGIQVVPSGVSKVNPLARATPASVLSSSPGVSSLTMTPGSTVTVNVETADPPSLSVTVSVPVYSPSDAYACVACRPCTTAVPSPKSHSYTSCVLSTEPSSLATPV